MEDNIITDSQEIVSCGVDLIRLAEVGVLWTRYWTFVLHKMRKFLEHVRMYSQERICSVQFIASSLNAYRFLSFQDAVCCAKSVPTFQVILLLRPLRWIYPMKEARVTWNVHSLISDYTVPHRIIYHNLKFSLLAKYRFKCNLKSFRAVSMFVIVHFQTFHTQSVGQFKVCHPTQVLHTSLPKCRKLTQVFARPPSCIFTL
jgi:hypothetical protein